MHGGIHCQIRTTHAGEQRTKPGVGLRRYEVHP